MRAVWPALLVLLGFCAAPALGADARFAHFSKQLQTATDARGRVQAAVGLGQLGDPAAVPILCKALADKEDIVKVAAAKSLDDIGDPSAIGCLKSAARPGSALGAISAALKSLEAAKSAPAAKLYVSLAPPDNKAGLSAEELTLLNDQLKTRLTRMGAVFAPPDESKAAAAKVMKAKKLQGVALMTTVEKHEAGLSLTLVGMTYPEKSIKGQITVKAKAGRRSDIIRALVPKVVENAAEDFEWEQ